MCAVARVKNASRDPDCYAARTELDLGFWIAVATYMALLTELKKALRGGGGLAAKKRKRRKERRKGVLPFQGKSSCVWPSSQGHCPGLMSGSPSG
jgi:hypothetical protein